MIGTSATEIDAVGDRARRQIQSIYEHAEAMREELAKVRREHFLKSLGNTFTYLLLGILLTLGGFGIFQFHNQKNDLMNSWAASGAKNQIIRDYKKELMKADGKELRKIVDDWNKKNQK